MKTGKQDTGNRKQDTGNRKTGHRKQETGNRKQETGHRKIAANYTAETLFGRDYEGRKQDSNASRIFGTVGTFVLQYDCVVLQKTGTQESRRPVSVETQCLRLQIE